MGNRVKLKLPHWLSEDTGLPTRLKPDRALEQTDKAIMILYSSESYWLPKSKIEFVSGSMQDLQDQINNDGKKETVPLDDLGDLQKSYSVKLEKKRINSGYDEGWLWYELQGQTELNDAEINTLCEYARKEVEKEGNTFPDPIELDREPAQYPGKVDGLQLRDYQGRAVAAMAEAGSCFLFDSVGLGKTITTLNAVEQKNSIPCLITCPKQVEKNWKKEIEKWFPERSVTIVEGQKGHFYDAEYVICHIDILSYRKDDLIQTDWSQIIVDESAKIKNPEAKRTKAALELSEQSDDEYCLSGTPVMNSPDELWSQLKLIGHELGDLNYYAYCRRWTGGHKGRFGFEPYNKAKANIEGLKKKIQDVFIRRTKNDVLDELPELQRQWHEVGVSNEYVNEYGKIMADFAETHSQFKKEAVDTSNVLAKAMKLRQYAAMAKSAAVTDMANQIIDSGRVLIIHCSFLEPLEIISKNLNVDIAWWTGENKTDDMVERFRGGEFDVILASDALKEGMNLQRADEIWHTSLQWRPTDHTQVEGRAHRMGRDEPVISRYFTSNLGIDKKLANTLESKLDLIGNLVGEGTEAGMVEGADDAEQVDRMSILSELAKEYKGYV